MPSSTSASYGDSQNTPRANPSALDGSNTTLASQGPIAATLNNTHQPTLQLNAIFAQHTSDNTHLGNMGGAFGGNEIAAPWSTGLVDLTAVYDNFYPPPTSSNSELHTPPWNLLQIPAARPLPAGSPQLMQPRCPGRTSPPENRDAVLLPEPRRSQVAIQRPGALAAARSCLAPPYQYPTPLQRQGPLGNALGRPAYHGGRSAMRNAHQSQPATDRAPQVHAHRSSTEQQAAEHLSTAHLDLDIVDYYDSSCETPPYHGDQRRGQVPS